MAAGDGAETPRVAMVSPDWAEGIDGIRDYTLRLSEALAARGVEVVDVKSRRWGPRQLPSLRDRIAGLQPCVLHVQHPSSYGLALAPQTLSLLNRGVVTLHEASIHSFRALVIRCLPFTLRASHVVFTSSFERHYVERRAPWVRRRSSVIPIASNLPAGEPPEEREDEIVYFGTIRPGKGVEDVISLANLLRDKSLPWRVRIVGTPSWWWRDYAAGLRRQSEGLPVVWSGNLSGAETAATLARAKVAYLPFPDGVSERRGSLLAVLANGVAVVTTAGNQTPPAMKEAFAFAGSAADALPIVQRLLENPREWDRQAAAGQAFFATIPSWDEIAAKHIAIYRAVAARYHR